MVRVDQDPIAFWNGPAAEKWIRLRPLLDAEVGPFGEAAMDEARVRPGETVLDVGCGCGTTTLELARRVGAEGRVVGVDVSAPMIAVARERAAAEGATQVALVVEDAATFTHALRFDLLYSRFGWMFFLDPVSAFAHLRERMAGGGRASLVCWRPLAENAWANVPLTAVLPITGTPEPTPPGAPGPFAFADPDRSRDVLERAGWQQIRVEPVDREVLLGAGGGLEGAVEHAMAIGPAARALIDAGAAEDEALRQRARDALRAALAPRLTSHGVPLAAAGWLVTAAARR